MKIDTNTILIAGAVGVGIYLLTRPKAVPPGYNPVTGLPYNYGSPGYQTPGMPVYNQGGNNTFAQDANAAGGVLEGISSILGNFF